MRIAFLLYFGNKNLKEIQLIVTSTKVANLAKQAVRAIVDFVLIVKKSSQKELQGQSQRRSILIVEKKPTMLKIAAPLLQMKRSQKNQRKKSNGLNKKGIKPKP